VAGLLGRRPAASHDPIFTCSQLYFTRLLQVLTPGEQVHFDTLRNPNLVCILLSQEVDRACYILLFPHTLLWMSPVPILAKVGLRTYLSAQILADRLAIIPSDQRVSQHSVTARYRPGDNCLVVLGLRPSLLRAQGAQSLILVGERLASYEVSLESGLKEAVRGGTWTATRSGGRRTAWETR